MIATAPDGTRLHYLVEGHGPPLVLVGGKTSDIEGAWWRYIPVLAQKLRVIAFDNRGSGASDKPDTPYTTRLMADDALAVLEAAGERSAHWFGLSLGGMILQELALSHPDAVSSLILGATRCRGSDETGSRPAETQPALANNPLRRFASLYAPEFILEHPDWVSEDAKRFGKMPLHAIQRQDQAVRHHDACDRLRTIKVPVLIIHGREDRLVPVEEAEALHQILPRSRIEIFEGAGHQVHSERFDAVVDRVLHFVSEVEAQHAVRPASGPGPG
jgi:pimeloyl-ACP methyl ester carboxylesterase